MERGGAELSPLAVPAWRLGVAGRMLSSGAAVAIVVAAGWVVHEREGSAVAVAVLALVSRVPGVLVGLHSGAVADARDVRAVTRVLTLAQAVPVVALAVLSWDGDPATPAVYVGVGVISLLSAFSTPAMQLEVNATVPAAVRRRAIALSNAAGWAAGVLGAAAAGALIAVDGPRLVFALAGVAAVGVAIVFARFAAPARERVDHVPVRRALAQTRHAAWWLAGAALLMAFVLEPLAQLAPVVARRHGHSAHLLGLDVAAIALGAMIGALWFARLDRHQTPAGRVLPAAMGAAAALLLVLALVPEFALVLVAMVLCGACWELCGLATLFGLFGHVPDERVGLAFGGWLAVTGAGAAAGTLVLGRVMDVAGVDTALLGSAGATVLFAAAWEAHRRRAPRMG